MDISYYLYRMGVHLLTSENAWITAICFGFYCWVLSKQEIKRLKDNLYLVRRSVSILPYGIDAYWLEKINENKDSVTPVQVDALTHLLASSRYGSSDFDYQLFYTTAESLGYFHIVLLKSHSNRRALLT